MGLKLDRLVQGVIVVAATIYGGPSTGQQVAAGFGALVATENVIQGRRSADIQQEQQREQQNLAKLSRQKAIRKQVQQAQLLQARNEARAQATGTTGSSALFGSTQALTSSAGRNILDIQQTGQVEQRISGLSGDITRRRSRAATSQSLFQVSTSSFGQKAFTTIFD